MQIAPVSSTYKVYHSVEAVKFTTDNSGIIAVLDDSTSLMIVVLTSTYGTIANTFQDTNTESAVGYITPHGLNVDSSFNIYLASSYDGKWSLMKFLGSQSTTITMGFHVTSSESNTCMSSTDITMQFNGVAIIVAGSIYSGGVCSQQLIQLSGSTGAVGWALTSTIPSVNIKHIAHFATVNQLYACGSGNSYPLLMRLDITTGSLITTAPFSKIYSTYSGPNINQECLAITPSTVTDSAFALI